MTRYEKRVKRLHDHVMKNTKKKAKEEKEIEKKESKGAE